MQHREIKFRAWDKDKKYMFPHSDLHKILVGNESIVSISYKPKGGGWEPEAPYHFTNSQTDNLEIMQFTGLKDKNGVEIYEGDILGYWGSACWEVKYGKRKAGFVYGGENWESLLSEVSVKGKEVIGNIYENPELLKA